MAPAVRCEQGQLSDTIYALSSGRPPAAIAVIRISGPQAFAAVRALAGSLPAPRRASLRTLHREEVVLDQALVLTFPGPLTATGEDLAELHCHGGRAVVAAVEAALAAQPGVRLAQAGEFTRRALTHGRIDLLQAEGLADLLEAETEAQRVAALSAAEGRLSARTRAWLDTLASLSAMAESLLDYAEEDDVAGDAVAVDSIRRGVADLRTEILSALDAPSVERLRDGVRVVIAGPPNAGKSTLLNLLADRDVAIVSPIAGTTRDRVEAPVARNGLPLLLIDTAGLTETSDPIEAVGVERAKGAIGQADIVLWLGDDAPPPHSQTLWVHARADRPDRGAKPPGPVLSISAHHPKTIADLWREIGLRAEHVIGWGAVPPMHERQRHSCFETADALADSTDVLLLAEGLARARRCLARLLGLDATEVMLDALFGRFCLGK